MELTSLFFRERSLSKVAAVFTTGDAAQSAARRLHALPDLTERQVQLILPHDRDWARKIEPEGVGIMRTAIRSHLACGTLGFACGMAAFAALYLAGVAAIVSSAGLSLMAFALFGTTFGLMLGGLLTLRPDHEFVVEPVREAVRDGQWAIVVHPVSQEQRRHAAFLLRATGGRVSETL
jgi:hypothetical protein